MKTTIPKGSLTYVAGSDNPLLPELILNLSKGENGTITGTGHLVARNRENDGFRKSQQLPVKGTYITTGNKVIIELNGFEENGPESVAYIQLTLDDQWSGGAGSYRYVKPFVHHAQLEAKQVTVHQVSFAVMPV